MADALRVQELDRLADLGRRPPFSGVHGAAETEVAGERVGTGVVAETMRVCGTRAAGEVDADDGGTRPRHADERLEHRRVLAEQAAQDEPRAAGHPLGGRVDDRLRGGSPVELGREADLQRRHAFAGGVVADLVGHATHGGGRLQHGQAQLEAAQRGGEAHPAPESELRRDVDPEARRQLSQRRLPQGAVEVAVEVGQGRQTHRRTLLRLRRYDPRALLMSSPVGRASRASGLRLGTFVIVDASGSVKGEKLQSAVGVLLDSLRPADAAALLDGGRRVGAGRTAPLDWCPRTMARRLWWTRSREPCRCDPGARAGETLRESLKLMAVLAHPDDESLGLGGTLAKYAAEGVEISLVTATRGEGGRFRGHRDPPEHPGPVALGRIREGELRAAAAALGARSVALLDYRDGELDRADPREATRRIVGYVRSRRPQVVITFAPDGAYGHPDHVAISQLATAAVVAAADPTFADGGEGGPPHAVSKLYYIAWPASTWAAYQEAFRDLVARVDGVERRVVPWPDWAITTVVDTRAWWPNVWRAVSCHESQIAAYERLGRLSPERHEALWGWQSYYRAFSLVNGGRARETDLFEGLRP